MLLPPDGEREHLVVHCQRDLVSAFPARARLTLPKAKASPGLGASSTMWMLKRRKASWVIVLWAVRLLLN
jgi:hypothetical protein